MPNGQTITTTDVPIAIVSITWKVTFQQKNIRYATEYMHHSSALILSYIKTIKSTVSEYEINFT